MQMQLRTENFPFRQIDTENAENKISKNIVIQNQKKLK